MQNEIKKVIFKVLTPTGSGSCFKLQGYDFFITNYHVVEGFLEVALEDREKNRFLAKVVMLNKKLDLAFLYAANLEKLQSPIIIDKNLNMENIQQVKIYGYPFGMGLTVTQGIISSYKQKIDSVEYIQTDAAINPGNSGGAMLDDNRLVGVVCSKFSDADNVGFAISYLELQKELELFRLDKNTFLIKCLNCNSFINQEEKFCKHCGSSTQNAFYKLSKPSYIEELIDSLLEELGLNPTLCRIGQVYWSFYYKEALIRIFDTAREYFFVTAPINSLPQENLEEVLEYIVKNPKREFMLGLDNNNIYLSYRIHKEHLYNKPFLKTILNNIKTMIQEAPKIQTKLADEFGCKKFRDN